MDKATDEKQIQVNNHSRVVLGGAEQDMDAITDAITDGVEVGVFDPYVELHKRQKAELIALMANTGK